jgi:hypothetical protein
MQHDPERLWRQLPPRDLFEPIAQAGRRQAEARGSLADLQQIVRQRLQHRRLLSLSELNDPFVVVAEAQLDPADGHLDHRATRRTGRARRTAVGLLHSRKVGALEGAKQGAELVGIEAKLTLVVPDPDAAAENLGGRQPVVRPALDEQIQLVPPRSIGNGARERPSQTGGVFGGGPGSPGGGSRRRRPSRGAAAEGEGRGHEEDGPHRKWLIVTRRGRCRSIPPMAAARINSPQPNTQGGHS